MNMVNDLLKKSDPTIDNAVAIEPEKRREVTNVTLPAIIRHAKALTADLKVVSEKEPFGAKSAIAWPFRYSCFLDLMVFRDASNFSSVCMAFILWRSMLASFFSKCLRKLSDEALSPPAVVAAKVCIGVKLGLNFIGVEKAEITDTLAIRATTTNFFVE